MADQADPFETLKDSGQPVIGLPAAEVRRRGDRFRRRRTAFRAVAAGAAVAVVVTGGVALGGGPTRTAPPPRPATEGPSPQVSETVGPEPTWTTLVPEGFPLDLGFPEARFDETTRVGPKQDYQPIDHVEVCGRTGFPTEEWAHLLGASFEQPEDYRHRMLTTYPDAETAHAVVARLADAYRACPRQTDDLGWARTTELREVEPGDEGYLAIQTSELEGAPAPGLGLTYLVRVGNAVLLLTTSNEGGGTERQIDTQVREQTPLVTGLADAMCIFSPDGCSSPST